MNALAKKLLMKPGQSWLILNAPESYPSTLEPVPDNTQLIFSLNEASVNGMQIFAKNSSELEANLAQIKPILTNDTVLWIIYPKKNSGVPTDLEMMGSWDIMAAHGLRPVASAAVNGVWTALRFRPEHLVKKSDSSKQAIGNKNDYSSFIDPDTKTVMLPADAMEALAGHPTALGHFDKLAYSHKKEYAVWILSAKQEQTRQNRIAKMVEMLLAGKRNPTDK
ncbi:hypothetical protein FPZ43_12190 [Mucilaginibacter pallidiroseus]|uniref:Bacteriocin-protection, YdeI or OmpD-Associated n=1 Tax=Mucilaginibacter pallidiroseus TaxID=2599295 RepID=A0A563UCC0_9SPHI|nr:YdeI/OmpD-associated family protein [Mucilaginibacter pallidiroseus]TWR29015.1 hypothetical protein FPZ43_12190 [Mucilaginibacter pallidiroseus]